MADIFVAYDQLLDAYIPVQQHNGLWREVDGLEEETFNDLPALSGKQRYQALADVHGVDRKKAYARANRAIKQRTKQVAKWNDELEMFLATMAVRHAQREHELEELRNKSQAFIEELMNEKV